MTVTLKRRSRSLVQFDNCENFEGHRQKVFFSMGQSENIVSGEATHESMSSPNVTIQTNAVLELVNFQQPEQPGSQREWVIICIPATCTINMNKEPAYPQTLINWESH